MSNGLKLRVSAKSIYFIGIGGVGMSAIAKVVKTMGFQVMGSDLVHSKTVESLEKMGIKVYLGHQGDYLRHAHVVVTSSAISPVNAEVILAKKQGIPVIERGEMLAELMRLNFGIAVAGTHGKTTTTSLIADVVSGSGLSPTSVIGGQWFGTRSNATLGKGDILICEADESDGSFLKLSPVMGVITNIDFDHMDYFKTEERQITYFMEFINRLPFYGKGIICYDDMNVYRLRKRLHKPTISYGIMSKEATVRALDITYHEGHMRYKVVWGGESLGEFCLSMMGVHNVLNSLAAIIVARELSLNMKQVKRSLSSFMGVARRMSFLGYWKGFRVIDDYGHHPTEVRITIETIAEQTKRLICVFQPHRYTRTLIYYEAFAKSFAQADVLYLMDIFPAGESPIEEVSTALIYERVKEPQQAHYLRDAESIVEHLNAHYSQGEGTLLTIGAGDVYKMAQQLVEMKTD